MKSESIRRKVFAALVSVGVLSLSGLPAVASDSATHSSSQVPGFHSVLFEETGALKMAYSVLQVGSSAGMQLCKSTSDSACAGGNFYKFNAVLKACSVPSDSDCVDSVGSVSDSGSINTGVFKLYTVENQVNEFQADARLHIPTGGMPSIWDIPSAPHESGSLYAVVAQIVGNVTNSGHIGERVVTTSLVPVYLKTSTSLREANWDGHFYDNCRDVQQTPTRRNIQCSFPSGTDCILPIDDGYKCYVAENFPSNTRLNLKLRLSMAPAGWLHGRLVSPDIQITKLGNSTLLSISGEATSVPSVYQQGMWDSFPDSLKTMWIDCMANGDKCGTVGSNGMDMNYWEKSMTLAGNSTTNLEGEFLNYGRIALEGMKAIAPLVGDKAIANPQHWNFRTLSVDEMSSANDCFTAGTGVKGIVTTNSTTYSEGPPEFANGSLNYKVSSAHYLPDGTVFKGNYNLVVRSDVARCLYKFSSAPIKASIEVVSENGDASNVATTVANEKDGWLYLSANNFTFSAPTVKVKLTQSRSGSTSTTITCAKGKITKKVTSVKPVCPKGYIKK